MAAYDDNNIFARILRGELPCSKAHETDHALAFHDINPQAPIHVLVIPKGRFVSMDDFSRNASAEAISGLWRAVGEVAQALGLVDSGYRVMANHGGHAHQEVSFTRLGEVSLFEGSRESRCGFLPILSLRMDLGETQVEVSGGGEFGGALDRGYGVVEILRLDIAVPE